MEHFVVTAGTGTAGTPAAAVAAALRGVGLGHAALLHATGCAPAGSAVHVLERYPDADCAAGDIVPAFWVCATATGHLGQAWAAVAWADLGQDGVRFITVDGDSRGHVEATATSAITEVAAAVGHDNPDVHLVLAGGPALGTTIGVVVLAAAVDPARLP